MRTLCIAVLTLALASRAFAADEKKAPAAKAAADTAKPAAGATPATPEPPKPDTDKALKTIGNVWGKNLNSWNLTDAERDKVFAAMREGMANPGKVKMDQPAMENANRFVQTRSEAKAEADKKKGAEYVAQQAKAKGAIKTEGGAIVLPMKEGTGASPGPTDKVKVHYTGTLLNGSVFDDSRERKQPAEFTLNGVVPCWTQALQKMKVGGRAKIVCPSDLAYGPRGMPPNIPPNSALTFDVELLDVTKAAPAPAPLPPPPANPLTPNATNK
jgi:FKBP-type peptidyl-prolyl cis-trans isomerase